MIELMVVIAIIGILAAIILVSLSNARNSGKNARIKSDIQQLRAIAITYQDVKKTDGSGAVDWNAFVAATGTLRVDLAAQNGDNNAYKLTFDSTDACQSSPLVGSTDYYCADTKGGTGKKICIYGVAACQ